MNLLARPISRQQLKALELQQKIRRSLMIQESSFNQSSDNSVYHQATPQLSEEGEKIQKKFQKIISKRKITNEKNASFYHFTIKTMKKNVEIMNKKKQKELAFIDFFKQINLLDREKEIKFFQCTGDKNITNKEIKGIKNEFLENENKFLRDVEVNGMHRYVLLKNFDKPIVEQALQRYECNWDISKNIKSKKRFLVIKSIVKGVTKHIIEVRMFKRLSMIKDFLKGIKTKEEVQQLVIDDWLNSGQTTPKKDDISFQFSLESNNITPFLYGTQYDPTNMSSNFNYDVNPRSGFDDWSPIEPLNYCDHEVMQYKNLEIQPTSYNYPVEVKRPMRTGAEEEYFIRGELGPVETQEEIDELKVILPPILKKPFDTPTYIFLVPHKTMRKQLNYFEQTEVDPEYYLKPSYIHCLDALDLEENQSIELTNYLFTINSPGVNNLNVMERMKIEFSYFFYKSWELPADYIFETNMEDYCPDLMEEPTGEDLQNDAYYEDDLISTVEYENVASFLEAIEMEDKEELNEIRDKISERDLKKNKKIPIANAMIEMKNKINQNLAADKTKRLNQIPTITSEYNKFIANNNMKLFIL